MLTADSAHGRHNSRRSMVSSSHSTVSEPIQRVFKVLESEDEAKNAKANSAGNACCFVFVSPALCPPTAQSVTFAQEVSDKGEADNIDFFVCDVNTPLGAATAKLDAVGSLPAFSFYYDGQKLEEFSGDSHDKFKICCQAARAKRIQIQKQKEKEKEEAEKAAAAAAAAA